MPVGWPYLIILIGFLAFVIQNESIVVGDKTAHSASFHAVMLLYFFALNLVLGFPACLEMEVRRLSWKAWAALVLIFGLGFGYVIHRYTMVHPYILADNRHYTFYIWAKLLRHAPIRYGLSPLYAVACALTWR